MPSSDVEVVIVGGGAAGIAAARRLCHASIRCLVVEARPRLGGQAGRRSMHRVLRWTSAVGGCIPRIAIHGAPLRKSRGLRSTKPRRPGCAHHLRSAFRAPSNTTFTMRFKHSLCVWGMPWKTNSDVPAATFLDPSSRWNGLIKAVGTYISGAELDRLSAKDFDRYEDSGVNWRVVEGYGSIISAYGAHLPMMLDCRVSRIDHRGKRLRIETTKGVVAADQAIVTIPSALIAAERLRSCRYFRKKPRQPWGCRWDLPTNSSCRLMTRRSLKKMSDYSDTRTARRRALIISGHSAGQ